MEFSGVRAGAWVVGVGGVLGGVVAVLLCAYVVVAGGDELDGICGGGGGEFLYVGCDTRVDVVCDV